jgi:hypothetical protein
MLVAPVALLLEDLDELGIAARAEVRGHAVLAEARRRIGA